MKNKFIEALNYIRTIPFYSGGYQNSNHETEIENILKRFSFKETIKPPGCKNLKSCEDILENGHYISQPAGKNNNPDILLRIDNRFYYIELKSSKKSKPMFNSALPKSGVIYIFTSEKRGTSILLSDELLTSNQYQICKDVEEQVKLYTRSLLMEKLNTSKISAYTRFNWEIEFDYFNMVDYYFQNVKTFILG